MANTTNFGWETPDDTDLVKDGALAMRTLGNAIDTSLVDLKGGTTNQVLAKNSDTDLDFKWVADATGIPATIIDARGDLIVGTAADTAARLAVGTNNYFLQAASGETTGLQWAGAMTSYTPVYNNLTIGNGTVISEYLKIGKIVMAQYSLTFGSTSSVSGAIFFTTPSTMSGFIAGTCVFVDAGTANYYGVVRRTSSTQIQLSVGGSAGNYVNETNTSATIPFTWTTGDVIYCQYFYVEA